MMGWQRPPARTLGFRAGRAGESTRRANRQPPRSRRRSAKHRGRPRRRVHHLDDPGPSPHRRRCSTRSSSILHPGTPRSRHPVCNAGTPRPTRSLSFSLPFFPLQISPAPPTSPGPFQFTLKPPCLTGRYVSHSIPPLASRPARWADLGPNLSLPHFCGDGHSRPSRAPPPPAPARTHQYRIACPLTRAAPAPPAAVARPTTLPLPSFSTTHSPARRHDSSSTRVSVIWASCPRSAPSAAGVR